MSIAPISALTVSGINIIGKKSNNKQKADNLHVQNETAQNTNNDNGAFKSYFLGSHAVSFGFGVKTNKFVTKEIKDVPCCCCGGKMILPANLDKKANEFAVVKGNALADKIEQDIDFFRTPQKLIMSLTAEQAKIHPEYDLSQAKKAAGKNLKTKTEDYCINSLKKADTLIKATCGEDNLASDLIADEIDYIYEGNIDRMHFTDRLEKYKDKIDPVTYNTVINAAMNIPVDFKEVKNVFSEAIGNSKAVAKNLLEPSIQTIEHVHPRSLGGPDASENFIAECKDCNNKRSNISYIDWLKIHPEFPQKAQVHLEWFQQQLVDGKIDSKYDSWGTDIKKTLSKESNGLIELKVLNSEKIRELREAKKAGQKVIVSDEIKKICEEEEKAEKTAA